MIGTADNLKPTHENPLIIVKMVQIENIDYVRASLYLPISKHKYNVIENENIDKNN